MLAIAAAVIFAVLGLIHPVYTVRDSIRPPRYFLPRGRVLHNAMRRTWTASLGFCC